MVSTVLRCPANATTSSLFGSVGNSTSGRIARISPRGSQNGAKLGPAAEGRMPIMNGTKQPMSHTDYVCVWSQKGPTRSPVQAADGVRRDFVGMCCPVWPPFRLQLDSTGFHQSPVRTCISPGEWPRGAEWKTMCQTRRPHGVQ